MTVYICGGETESERSKGFGGVPKSRNQNMRPIENGTIRRLQLLARPGILLQTQRNPTQVRLLSSGIALHTRSFSRTVGYEKSSSSSAQVARQPAFSAGSGESVQVFLYKAGPASS